MGNIYTWHFSSEESLLISSISALFLISKKKKKYILPIVTFCFALTGCKVYAKHCITRPNLCLWTLVTQQRKKKKLKIRVIWERERGGEEILNNKSWLVCFSCFESGLWLKAYFPERQ